MTEWDRFEMRTWPAIIILFVRSDWEGFFVALWFITVATYQVYKGTKK